MLSTEQMARVTRVEFCDLVHVMHAETFALHTPLIGKTVEPFYSGRIPPASQFYRSMDFGRIKQATLLHVDMVVLCVQTVTPRLKMPSRYSCRIMHNVSLPVISIACVSRASRTPTRYDTNTNVGQDTFYIALAFEILLHINLICV